LKVYIGQTAAIATNKPVTISKVYKYKASTGKYTDQAATASTTATLSGSAAGQPCTCTNALREIEYNIKLKWDSTIDTVYKNRYVIDSVSAVVVLYED
jgi:hypothetical protein